MEGSQRRKWRDLADAIFRKRLASCQRLRVDRGAYAVPVWIVEAEEDPDGGYGRLGLLPTRTRAFFEFARSRLEAQGF